jgi:4-carboxymuconolactone decarboxylase
MKDSDLYRQGASMRRKLLGDKRMGELDANYQDPAMQKFMELSTEIIFGGIWSRPGLDTKTRIMICVISDTATGRIAVLPEHVRMAMNEGWTEDELTEALLQLVGYVGAPLVRDAMNAVVPVFAERRAAAKR